MNGESFEKRFFYEDPDLFLHIKCVKIYVCTEKIDVVRLKSCFYGFRRCCLL